MGINPKIISVIICTYNRAVLLAQCLENLYSQTLDRNEYDIIVVDNNSADHTAAVVSAHVEKYGNIRYVKEERQGLSHARNRGCAEATAEYLIYLDDDSLAPSEYLGNVVEVIKQHSPDIMGGPAYPYYTSRKPGWFKDEYETKKFANESGFSRDCSITGCNFIIRKDVLEKLGMFDPDYGIIGKKLRLSEERQVLEKYRNIIPLIEQKVYYSLECYVKHHIPKEKMRFSYFIKRSFLAGKGLAKIDIQVRHNNSAVASIRSKFRKLFGMVNSPLNLKQTEKMKMDFLICLRYLIVAAGQAVEMFSQLIKRDKSQST